MRTKRFPLQSDADSEHDELFKKIYPIILDIFCNGVVKTEPKKLVLGALGSFALIPFDLITSIFHRSIHLLILFLTWWFLSAELAIYPSLEKVMLTLALLAIFYKDLYKEIVSILLYMLIIITNGKFMHWLCEGYLSGAGFRHNSFTGKKVENLIIWYVALIPTEYRIQYEEFLNLHSDSNNPEIEEKLTGLIEKYWQQPEQT